MAASGIRTNNFITSETLKFDHHWFLHHSSTFLHLSCFIEARRQVFERFKTLPERWHSPDVIATVPAIFRRAERFGYALLSHCFNVCAIVCGLSEMSQTLHLLFHRINYSWQLLYTLVYCDDVINGHIYFSNNNNGLTSVSKPASSKQFLVHFILLYDADVNLSYRENADIT